MSSGESFFESKKFKNIMKFVYGYGGAIVIVGAMFKIMHWPFASALIVAGLTTEAIIFILSGHEPLHEEVDWSLVYPELATGEVVEGGRSNHGGGMIGDPVSQQLDNMLVEANIGPDLIESLGNGMRAIANQAESLKETGDVAVANNTYISNLEAAAERVGKLSQSYEEASQSLMGLRSTHEEGASFGEMMTKVTDNLKSLNDVYELQLRGASEHLENTNKFNSGVTELMDNLNASVEHTKNYRENMSDLTKNLTALNTIYGNMLNAMNVNVHA